MDLYVPDAPMTPAPIVVSMHYCSGNKGNAQPWFQSYADDLGFIVITPQAGGNCFDASPARSGERANIVAMVQYAIENHDGDPSRVFAAGASSGACMTQALLASYPEVFAAGASLAGVPAGAWTSGNNYGWSTPQQSDELWGNRARDASEGFTGPWPRVQLWHGQGDSTLTYSQNYPAQVAQWTNVHGVTDADSMNEMTQPMGAQDNWDRTSYSAGGVVVVEANSAGSGVPHDLTGRGLWGDVVRFFALAEPPSSEPDVGGAGGMTGGGGSGGTVSSAGGAAPIGMGGAAPAAGGAGGSTPVDVPAPVGPPGSGGANPNLPGTSTPAPTVTTSPTAVTPDTTPGAPTSPSAVPTTAPQPSESGTAPSGSTPAPVTSGEAPASAGDDGGCSVSAGGHSANSPWALFAVGLLGLFFGRRRR
jgi:poly(hydroxyalkanoate) depolymerase family esterase